MFCFVKSVSNASRMMCGGKSVRLNEVSLFIGFDFSFRPIASRPSFFDARQNVRDHLALGLRADVAFAMQTDGNISGVHVAAADDEHRVDFRLLGFLNLPVD